MLFRAFTEPLKRVTLSYAITINCSSKMDAGETSTLFGSSQETDGIVFFMKKDGHRDNLAPCDLDPANENARLKNVGKESKRKVEPPSFRLHKERKPYLLGISILFLTGKLLILLLPFKGFSKLNLFINIYQKFQTNV